jgi:hypothetical protein
MVAGFSKQPKQGNQGACHDHIEYSQCQVVSGNGGDAERNKVQNPNDTDEVYQDYLSPDFDVDVATGSTP